jgi:hypothetical protein
MIDDIVDQHYLNFLFLIKKTRKKNKKTTKNNNKPTNKQTNKNMHRLAFINTRYKKNLSSR